MPVVVLGLSGAPNAGDELLVVESERKAREVALYRQGKFRDVKLARQSARVPRTCSRSWARPRPASSRCSSRPTCRAVPRRCARRSTKLSTDEVQVKIIASGSAASPPPTCSWRRLPRPSSSASTCAPTPGAREAIKETGVEVRYYSIIYEAIDDVKQMMAACCAGDQGDDRRAWRRCAKCSAPASSASSPAAWSTEGVVKRNNPIRVLRDNVVIFEGALESLRRFKDDVGEVRAGTECGIGVKNYQDVRAGDQIECLLARRGCARTAAVNGRSSSGIPRDRVGDAAVLAELIAREVKDPRVGNVTITAVSLLEDKSAAKIFFMPFASSNPPEEVQVA